MPIKQPEPTPKKEQTAKEFLKDRQEVIRKNSGKVEKGFRLLLR